MSQCHDFNFNIYIITSIYIMKEIWRKYKGPRGRGKRCKQLLDDLQGKGKILEFERGDTKWGCCLDEAVDMSQDVQ